MTVSVSGTLPSGDGNGLSAIVTDLVREPQKVHLAVVLVDCRKVVTDADTGDMIPTVRLRRIEVVEDPEDRKLAENLMRRALDRRTGRQALPYDLEQEIRSAFPDA